MERTSVEEIETRARATKYHYLALIGAEGGGKGVCCQGWESCCVRATVEQNPLRVQQSNSESIKKLAPFKIENKRKPVLYSSLFDPFFSKASEDLLMNTEVFTVL
jgi:hypothetical protein